MSYRKYFKDVSGFDVVDVYRTHRLFGVNDEVLCHASKKLLLSGVRTGGKTLEQDVTEARDSLNRWLEMLAEDLGNAQEKDGWTPQEIEVAAFRKSCDSAEVEWPDESRIDVIGQNGNDGAVYSEYTLQEVIGNAVLSDWTEWVAVDKNGMVHEYSHDVSTNCRVWQRNRNESKPYDFKFRKINKVVPPLNFKNCIWKIKK